KINFKTFFLNQTFSRQSKVKSKISLKQVRRAHYNASTKAVEHKLGAITQPMMSLTAFGFMGLKYDLSVSFVTWMF
uniref:Uncharacterized protein n=1 Tax=Megaselia scalaris TaxID=36166 RepID=T1GHL9_MEGSC